MNIGTSLKTISKNQLCSFIGTGGYVELEETDVLSDGSIVTAVAVLPLLNSRNDKGDGILPPGYQKMEFLESSGTQYLEINEPMSPTFGIQVKFAQPLGLYIYTWGFRSQGYGFRIIGRDYTYDRIFVGYVGSFLEIPAADMETVVASLNFRNNQKYQGSTATETFESPGNMNQSYHKTVLGGFMTTHTGAEVITPTLKKSRIYSAQISQLEEITRNLIPALDTDGTPCMFDTVKKQPFYNKGTGYFRVGIATLQQVRELQLPDNTGNAVKTLYLSLPQEARTDFTAQKHLADLASLNWSINTQYRDGDVPADYTKVDFLESTGTQIINTRWAPFSSLVEDVKSGYMVEGQHLTDRTWVATAGIERYAGYFEFRGAVRNASSFITQFCNQSFQISGEQDAIQERFTVEVNLKNSRKCIINTVNQTRSFDINTDNNSIFVQNINFCLFGVGSDVEGLKKTPSRIWRAKISEAEDILGDFIPAINPNGVPGMWDKVNKQFFENSGTGAFIVGIKTLNDARMLNSALPVVPSGSTYSITLSLPVEASTDAPAQKALTDLAARGWSINVQYREDEIPAGYAKVSFLESSASQWIDTGFIPNGNTRFRVDCKSGWNNTCVFFCAEDSWRKVAFGLSNLYIYNIFEVRYNNTVYSFPQYLTLDRFVAEFSGDVVTINGTQVATIPYQDYSCNYTLFLFANHRGGYSSDVHYVIIYSAKFWDQSTGEAIRDFIPVINTAGVPGMWDRVNKQFYENAGTGQFRVGLASKEAVRNLYLEPNVPAGTTINLSVPAGTTTEDTNILKANNPNYTFNIRYRS